MYRALCDVLSSRYKRKSDNMSRNGESMMEIDERFLDMMQQTITTLNEINHKLDDIEMSAQNMDHRQEDLGYSFSHLEQTIKNDNFIG
jgi:hypothetical protein